MENTNQHTHKLTLSNRNACYLTGVKNILSYNENEIVLNTEESMLLIKGNSLCVKRVEISRNTGEVNIYGIIDSLTYGEPSDTKTKEKSLLARLFK